MLMTGFGVQRKVSLDSLNAKYNARNSFASIEIFICLGLNALELYATGV